MNHQPFKDWLLSEEPLTQEQSLTMQEHLRECTLCQGKQAAWVEVENLFHKSPQAAPAPGFTTRWQEHLAAANLRQQRRQAWKVFAIIAGAAAILMFVLGIQVVEILRTPQQLTLVWISRLASLLSYAGEVEDFFASVTRALPDIPLIGLIFSSGFASLLGVLWLVAYQKITSVRRFAL